MATQLRCVDSKQLNEFAKLTSNAFHAWCHAELVSVSTMRDSSSTVDPETSSGSTVDDELRLLHHV